MTLNPKPQTLNPKPYILNSNLKPAFLRIGAFLGEGHAGELGVVCGVLRECIQERYGVESMRDALRLEVMAQVPQSLKTQTLNPQSSTPTLNPQIFNPQPCAIKSSIMNSHIPNSTASPITSHEHFSAPKIQLYS